MKKFSYMLLILVMLLAAASWADTEVPAGTVVGTWTKSESPYIVQGDIQIATLSVESGVRVLLNGNFAIEITGNIQALGTEEDPIFFTPADGVSSWKGMLFDNVTPNSVLDYCVIEKSNADGIRVINAPITIRNCTISGSTGSGAGGGMHIQGDLTLTNCVIEDNVIIKHNYYNPQILKGGGIYLLNGHLVLEGCTIRNNSLRASAVGYQGKAYGSGVCVEGTSSIEILRTRIYGNSAGGDNAYGGGLYFKGETLTVRNSIFNNNTVGGSQKPGGGILVASGTAEIVNSVFDGNNPYGVQGNDTTTIMNSIIWDNTTGQILSVPEVTYSCVMGGLEGVGNISYNPNYDADFKLLPGSSCIDVGNPDPSYNDGCIPPALGGTANDMGAYGGLDNCAWLKIPSRPTGLQAKVEGTRIALSWNSNSDSDLSSYLLFRSESQGDDGAAILETIPAGTVIYNDDSAVTGTRHYYRLKALNSGEKESDFSDEVCATPGDQEPPTQPAGFTAEPGDNQVILNWNINSDDCDLAHYRIYRSTTPGPGTVLADSVGLRDTTYVDVEDVVNGTNYYYGVSALDNAGNESGIASANTVPHGPLADLSLAKTVTTHTPNLFEEVTYTLTVTNNGTETSPSVVVTDTRDERLSFVPGSADASQGSFDINSGQWIVGDMDSDSSATLNLKFAVQAASDTLWNEAVVEDENSTDLNPENNTARTWVLGRACDLQVVKTIDNGTPNVGDTVTFTVAITNMGPAEAMGVEVVDHLPAGLTYLPGGINPSRGTWGGSIWAVGNMAIGQADTLLISAVVDGAAAITNMAEGFSSSPPDSNSENNKSSVSLNGQMTDLYLVKTVDNVAPAMGESVVFQVTVTNDGPSNATNVVVTDPVPEGLNLGTPTFTAGSYTDSTWTVGDLAANTSATLTLPVTVDVEGSITNSAYISGFDQTDPDPNNGFDYVTLSTDPVDIAVDKQVDRDFANIGETVTFTVTLNNLSPNDASGIRLLDQAAPGLTFVGNTPSAGTYDMGTGVWSLPTLAAMGTATLELQATVDRAIEIKNTAKIVGLEQADTDKNNNSESVTVTGEAADLALTNTVSPSQPAIDDVVTWVVTVKNNGPSAAGDIVINDALPLGLVLDSHSASAGLLDIGTMDWTIPSLAVDATASLTLTTTVKVAEPLCTRAEITASDKVDTRTDNDVAQTCINAVFADLAISKTADRDSVGIMEEVIFTLTVSNGGPNDASGIVVQDNLPDGMTFVRANSPDFSAGIWDVGELTVLESRSLEITARVDELGEHDNLAEIIAMNENDENQGNNSNHALVVGYDPPPVVTISGSQKVNAGEAVTVAALAMDNTGVVAATLFYRVGRTGDYIQLPMTAGAGTDTYEGVIPAEYVTDVGVACYVGAEDDAGGMGYSSHANISVTTALTVNPNAQPGGSNTSAYRIISIPVDLEDSRPASVLEDDLGTYNDEKWRMFGLNASQNWENSEFPNCGNMIPGRGFFLIVKEAGKVIDAGPGSTVPMSQPYVISLSAGWNLVGNPFNFDVPVSQITLGSGDQLDARNYLGSWGSLSQTSNFEPWQGYLVAANSDGETLVVDPVGAPGKKTDPARIPEVICSVSLLASIGGAVDSYNTAVVVSEASTGWDRLDRPEPPVIGRYVSVSFPHPDWETPFPAYSSDVRPLDEAEGQTWDVDVRTNIEGRVTLNFDGVASVPENMQVWLRDELLQTVTNLRTQEAYSYVGPGNGDSRRMQLVIGTDDFIKQAMPASEVVPVSLVLRENFPNPFNPMTTIRYGVPREGKVQLSIYDVRGRLVDQLVDEPKTAGYHAVVWDGTDRNGARVASGVYLYRVIVGEEIKTKKMLLMK